MFEPNNGYHEVDLTKISRNASNSEDDTFVGVRFDWNDKNSNFDIIVTFPLGYKISNDNETVRKEILNLISTLQTYKHERAALPNPDINPNNKNHSFPIQAYLDVMYDYIDRGGYYIERDEIYVRGNSGRINWNRTIRHEKPVVQKNGIAYLTMQVKRHSETDRNLITEIHKHCVYDSFLKLGWMYKFNLPPKPITKFNQNIFLSVLKEKLAVTHNDRSKKLIQSMIDIILFLDNTQKQTQNFNFGTNKFEYIWESLIDNIFGIKNKRLYFPRATWTLLYSDNKNQSALQPDTILKAEDLIVIDAKYYRYGETALPSHLPHSSSINKQITYGEYIHHNHEGDVYNAFLMPFNNNHRLFNTSSIYLPIGTARSDWKNNNKPHELVLGVLVDVKHLMFVKTKPNFHEIKQLSKTIKETIDDLLN